MMMDKRKARQKKWRTPEALLLLVAALGGSAGSILGMAAFRHKTRHKRFAVGLPLLFLLQAALAIGLSFWIL